MEYIIQELLEKVTEILSKEEKSLSELAERIEETSKDFGKKLLIYIIEKLDESIRNDVSRKRSWYVERYDTRKIHTSMGTLEFTRTYYVSKYGKKKKYAYLLDEMLGINKYERIDKKVEAKILVYANELSYEKAGKLFDEDLEFSKQTVRNKVQKFGNSIIPKEEVREKKVREYLYIDADEDHVALQSGKNKINKLIYVYEGKLEESKGRNCLINKRVFGSVEKSSEDLWLEVLDYLDTNYELEKVKKIYIQGDGAKWIKTGVSWIEKSLHVIDMFHLNKELTKLSGGNLNEGKGKVLKELIYLKDKEKFLIESKEILESEKDEKRHEKKKKALGYIKNQWTGIEEFIKHKETHKLGCSAEGHVSHIMASKMSSRPKGWSISGLEAITKLRIFIENSGTRSKIEEILKTENKRIAIARKEKLKNIKRLQKKTGEMLNNITSINIGKINGIYCAIKGLSKI